MLATEKGKRIEEAPPIGLFWYHCICRLCIDLWLVGFKYEHTCKNFKVACHDVVELFLFVKFFFPSVSYSMLAFTSLGLLDIISKDIRQHICFEYVRQWAWVKPFISQAQLDMSKVSIG